MKKAYQNFQKLYTNAARTIIHFAEWYGYELPSNDEAEDLLQELVLLKLEGDRQHKAKAFLTKFFEGKDRVDIEAIGGMDVNAEDIALEHLHNEEIRREVHRVVSALPVRCKETLTLRYLQGEEKSTTEVASLLDLTYQAVRAREDKAMHLLQHPSRAQYLCDYSL